MKEWHCVLFGQPHGPFSEDRLREMALQGVLLAETLVWSPSPEDAARGWVPAGQTELAAFFAPTAQTTAPDGDGAIFRSAAAEPAAWPEANRQDASVVTAAPGDYDGGEFSPFEENMRLRVTAAPVLTLDDAPEEAQETDAGRLPLRKRAPAAAEILELFETNGEGVDDAAPIRAMLLSQIRQAEEQPNAPRTPEPTQTQTQTLTHPETAPRTPIPRVGDAAGRSPDPVAQAINSRPAPTQEPPRPTAVPVMGVPFAPPAEPQPELAPLDRRLAAFAINLAIPLALGLVLYSVPSFWFFKLRVLAGAIAGAALLASFAYIAYTLFILDSDGQSVGKKLLRIRITDTEGDWAPIMNLLLRWLPASVCLGLLYLNIYAGLIAFLADTCFVFGKSRRTLHDRIAGTIVVSLPPKLPEADASETPYNSLFR